MTDLTLADLERLRNRLDPNFLCDWSRVEAEAVISLAFRAVDLQNALDQLAHDYGYFEALVRVGMERGDWSGIRDALADAEDKKT